MYREVDIKEAVMAALDGKPVFGLNPLCPQDIYNLTEQIEALVKDGDRFIVDEPEVVLLSADEPKVDAPKKNSKAKGSTPKKKVDDGKISALYDAGWSVAKIADEMGCSENTIYNHLETIRARGG